MKNNKLKNFFVKILFNKQSNDLLITLLYLPFLIVGLVTDLKYLIFLGGFSLVILNTIIKKVVRKRIDLNQYNFNSNDKLSKGGQ